MIFHLNPGTIVNPFPAPTIFPAINTGSIKRLSGKSSPAVILLRIYPAITAFTTTPREARYCLSPAR